MKNTPYRAHLDRVSSVIQHAEFLADEANDAEHYDIADRLRLQAARLAIELEEAQTRNAVVDDAQRVRHEQAARLRHACQRLDVELEARLPPEDAAALMVGMRASAESITRYRLKRLTEEQRTLLGASVDDCERALLQLEVAGDRALEATATAFVTRVRALGHAYALRRQLQRDKTTLLGVLPIGSAAAERVRRRVVCTRPAERLGRAVGADLVDEDLA
jgi:hypothetical protein